MTSHIETRRSRPALGAQAVHSAFVTRSAEVAHADARGVANLLDILSEYSSEWPEPMAETALAALTRLLARNPAHHVPPVDLCPGWASHLSAVQAFIDALRRLGDSNAASHRELRAFAAGLYNRLLIDRGVRDG